MKFCTTLSLIAFYISLASCRPQTVQIERQHLLHLQRSLSQGYSDRQELMAEKRGSLEETRRILQEIDRINVALGYTKRMSLAFPRVASGEGYFYPRQQFRPEFLTKGRVNYNQNTIRMNNQRAVYPFNNQNYYYPAPYLELPMAGKSQNFKTNKYFYPLIYAPNAIPYDMREFKNENYADGSIRLGTIVVLPKDSDEMNDREPKSVNEAPNKLETEKKATKNKAKPGQVQPSLIDQLVNYVPDALGLSDEDEDERQESIVSTTRLPAIKNDKFLNLALKKHPHESEDGDRKLPPPLPFNANRAFNFSNPIEKLQNFTKQFTLSPKSDTLKETTNEVNTLSPEDLEDAADDAADDKDEIASDQKSPFGFAFGPKQQLATYKEGGLIIQRLKVRRGGIAIAGPGGVATAGSGGTAIVGPNGIAFTHPRFESTTALPLGNGYRGFPIVVNDVNIPANRKRSQQVQSFYDLPAINFYGNYPYQFYQQYPFYPQQPNFVVVTPKPRSKGKSKPKASSNPRQLRKDTMKLTDARPKFDSRMTPEKIRQLPQMDIKLVQAIQQKNSKFIIEKFLFVPGQRIAELSTAESVPVSSVVRSNSQKVKQAVKSQKLKLQKQIFDEEENDEETSTVKVESIGMSAADQPIPDYSGFFPRSVFTQSGSGDEATLILEPDSKAISGNGGTSISTPISRAILRKGTAVKVLFRPQSVAITGAYGVAHAQADLLLDFIENDEN